MFKQQVAKRRNKMLLVLRNTTRIQASLEQPRRMSRTIESIATSCARGLTKALVQCIFKNGKIASVVMVNELITQFQATTGIILNSRMNRNRAALLKNAPNRNRIK